MLSSLECECENTRSWHAAAGGHPVATREGRQPADEADSAQSTELGASHTAVPHINCPEASVWISVIQANKLP